MCGRFVSTAGPASIAAWLGASVESGVDEGGPRYNIAPTATILAVSAGERRVGEYRWGLIPSWSKDPQIGARMINARAETLAEKPSFRNLIGAGRCAVPMDGFYEWAAPEPGSTSKTPYFIKRRDGAPLAVAGLWTTWRDRAGPGDPIRSTTLITCEANADLARVHHRMPVILDGDDLDLWLDGSVDDTAALLSVLEPADDGVLEVARVSTEVNNARNQGSHLIEPL